jgi:hypothetical protein
VIEYCTQIGNAGALVALRRIHHRVVAGLRRLVVECLRVAAPGRHRRAVAQLEHVGEIGAPGQRIVGDRPDVRHLTDRCENRRWIEHVGGDGALRRRENIGCRLGLFGSLCRKDVPPREHIRLRLRPGGARWFGRRSNLFGKATLSQQATSQRKSKSKRRGQP